MLFTHQFQDRGLKACVADHDGCPEAPLVRDNACDLALLQTDLLGPGLHEDPSAVGPHSLAVGFGHLAVPADAEHAPASEKHVLKALDGFGRLQGVHRHHEHAVAAETHQKSIQGPGDVVPVEPFVKRGVVQFGQFLGRHERQLGEHVERFIPVLLLDLQPVEQDVRVHLIRRHLRHGYILAGRGLVDAAPGSRRHELNPVFHAHLFQNRLVQIPFHRGAYDDPGRVGISSLGQAHGLSAGTIVLLHHQHLEPTLCQQRSAGTSPESGPDHNHVIGFPCHRIPSLHEFPV